jgi:hypothetical protein
MESAIWLLIDMNSLLGAANRLDEPMSEFTNDTSPKKNG